MSAVRTGLCAAMIFVCAMLPAACSKTPQLPLLAADATILAFGDSLTAGTGAGDAESYPAVLARLTGRNVVNAGVPGEVSAGGVQRLPELLERERPALLILCHGGNDLLARQNPQLVADNLRTMLRTAVERGVPVLLVAVPSPDLMLKPPGLYEELATLGGRVLIETLPEILDGQLIPTEQPDNATYCHLLSKEDALIDPLQLTSIEAERKVRAHLQYPKSKMTLLQQPVILTKVHIAAEVTSETASPLDVVFTDGHFLVIDELIGPSGRRMSGSAFLNGYAAA